MLIAMLYHPAHRKQMEAVKAYYRTRGHLVDTVEADFAKKPEAEYRNDFFVRNTCEWMVHLDSDEIILPLGLLRIEQAMKETEGKALRASIIDYVSDYEVAVPPRPYNPIVAVRIGTQFTVNRNIAAKVESEVIEAEIHHLGYVDRVLDWKIRNYIARNEIHELGNCNIMRSSERKAVEVPLEVQEVMKQL